ncbi:MAG: GC-type dockerin domain-anchored protein [Phycisphaerales bacterium JB037]
MKKRALTAPCLLAAVAGSAFAQPVIDGVIDADCYPALLWVNTNPTDFGDNDPANVPPAGDASTATTGIELVIPLSALGGATANGDIRLGGYVTSADGTFLSNQVIGGLPNLSNLGNPAIDFGAIAGNQFITITAATGGTAPTLDGTRDSVYGGPQAGWLQNNFTQFGDAGHGNIDGGGGSEINAVFAWTDGTDLYLMITGNLEANGNLLSLFFDTLSGGQQTLLNSNAVFDNPSGNGSTDVLNAQADISFDTGFEPDFNLTVAGRNTATDPDPAVFVLGATLATLPTAGSGTAVFLGNADYASGAAPTGADGGAPAVSFTVDNSNTAGVAGSPPVQIPSRDDSVGSELNGMTAYVNTAENRVYIMLTGNLQTNYNKIDLFFDVDGALNGQNTVRADNPDVDFDALGRMATDGIDPGLTFDEDFFADYFLSITNGGTNPVQMFSSAALMRTNGAFLYGGSTLGDYSCFDGGAKPDNDPLQYNGSQYDEQDGTATYLGSNYAPRISFQTLFDYVSLNGTGVGVPPPTQTDLITLTIDNSNIDGIDGSSAAGAADVTTGIEISIDLDELGYDPMSGNELRLVAFINGGGHDLISSNIIGDAVPGTIGEPRQADFSTIPGNQFVVIPITQGCVDSCRADLTGSSDPNDPTYGMPDGDADGDDFFFYLDAFSTGNLAVCDITGSSDPNDPSFDTPDGDCDGDDFFRYLDLFQVGCP